MLSLEGNIIKYFHYFMFLRPLLFPILLVPILSPKYRESDLFISGVFF